MPAVSTERVSKGDLKFTYRVNVNKEGVFSTTLPAEAVVLFEKAGLTFYKNKLRNSGYIQSDTYEGLKEKVNQIIAEYFSKEEIENIIILRYSIQTICTYCFNAAGEVVPNGSRFWTQRTDDQWAGWQEGNVEVNATYPKPFGFKLFVCPFRKISYRYKSGTIKAEYERINESECEQGSNLHWLASIYTMSEPAHAVHEILYDENAAGFFVNMIKSICELNERLKNFREPEALKELINSRVPLLGSGYPKQYKGISNVY